MKCPICLGSGECEDDMEYWKIDKEIIVGGIGATKFDDGDVVICYFDENYSDSYKERDCFRTMEEAEEECIKRGERVV